VVSSPTRVVINPHSYDRPELGLEVWKPDRLDGNLMPMLTPAYPSSNSSFSVSASTKSVMQDEFERGVAEVHSLACRVGSCRVGSWLRSRTHLQPPHHATWVSPCLSCARGERADGSHHDHVARQARLVLTVHTLQLFLALRLLPCSGFRGGKSNGCRILCGARHGATALFGQGTLPPWEDCTAP